MKATCLEDSTLRGPKVAASNVRCQECAISLEVVFQGPTNTKVVSTTRLLITWQNQGMSPWCYENALTGRHGEIKQAKTLFPAVWFSYYCKVGCILLGKNCSQQALVDFVCKTTKQYTRQDVPDGVKAVWFYECRQLLFSWIYKLFPSEELTSDTVNQGKSLWLKRL